MQIIHHAMTIQQCASRERVTSGSRPTVLIHIAKVWVFFIRQILEGEPISLLLIHSGRFSASVLHSNDHVKDDGKDYHNAIATAYISGSLLI